MVGVGVVKAGNAQTLLAGFALDFDQLEGAIW
jgi:hypothetical protein